MVLIRRPKTIIVPKFANFKIQRLKELEIIFVHLLLF